MRTSRWRVFSTVLLLILLDFFVQTINEPSSLPDWNVISFFPRETHVVSQQENLFKEDMFVIMRQAKKSSRLTAWRPLTPPYSVDIGCVASCRYRARCCPLSFLKLKNTSLAYVDRTFEFLFCQ